MPMNVPLSPICDRYGRQQDRPIAPWWFADTVARWARGYGRVARTEWTPQMGCFVTYLSRQSSDPVLGGRPEDLGEPIYWHAWKEGARRHPISGAMVGGFLSMNIEQMGATGVLEWLQKHDTWSGRGEFVSHEAAGAAVNLANDAKMVDKERHMGDVARGLLKTAMRHDRGHAQTNVAENITSR